MFHNAHDLHAASVCIALLIEVRAACWAVRAVVVGQKTFGKGVVQYYFPMDDSGSGLKVTVAKYLTPGGYDITRCALMAVQ